jgi:hypothetical protein
MRNPVSWASSVQPRGGAFRWRSARPGVARLLGVLLLSTALWQGAVRAQDLTPRAYVITPVGSNAVVLTYSHLAGEVQLTSGSPLTDAHSDVDLAIASYYRGFDLFGHSANFTLSVPYGFGDFTGKVAEVPKESERSGSLDVIARLGVNLLGGPALQPADFVRWHQSVLLGASLTIVAPTGQYDPTRLINFGGNRWAFKPELGYSQRWHRWVLDGYVAGWFFTENTEYFSHNMYFPGTQTRGQRPMGAIETHLSYDVKPRLWISLDANYWWGGEIDLNGASNSLTEQRSSRLGVTASVPLSNRQSIKLSFSDGAYVRYGGNYRSISLGWQYGWVELQGR